MVKIAKIVKIMKYLLAKKDGKKLKIDKDDSSEKLKIKQI